MANLQKSVKATEASNDALNAVVSKALGYPRAPVWVGGGNRAVPQAWDGQGQPPIGYTKQAVANYVASPADSSLPIDDTLAAQLQAAPAQALLSAGEKTTLSAALAARVLVDLDAAGTPKVLSIAVAAEAEKVP